MQVYNSFCLLKSFVTGKEDPTTGVRKSKRQAKKSGDASDSDDEVQEIDDEGKALKNMNLGTKRK